MSYWITFTIIHRRRKELSVTEIHVPLNISKHLSHPARWVFLTLCVLSTFPFLPIPAEVSNLLRVWLRVLLVILMGWFAIGCTYVFRDALLHRYDLATEDNVRARRVHTQMHFLFRLLIGFIVIVDIGGILWTFPNPQLWRFGSGLIASAGVATLVLATAAKSTVANLLAGLQIAFSEPIRIDDVVIVEGEWGRVEEITTSYVVIRIWDLRRLIVPLAISSSILSRTGPASIPTFWAPRFSTPITQCQSLPSGSTSRRFWRPLLCGIGRCVPPR
jgi:small-conductance mechanosensitive channel